MRRAIFARALPSAAISASCVGRTRTIANSAATKKPFAMMNRSASSRYQVGMVWEARYCSGRMRRLLAATLLLASCAPAPRELDVAAAISLKEALTEVARGWEARGGGRVVFNFAGSNVLARQIEAGAPVDVFLPADMRTADSIRDFLEPPVPLLANTLVVVSDRPMTSLRDLLPLGHVAIGDPSAVPAGVYAREALQQAGLWSAIEPKIVPCENVRAALKAVESGGADAAIVYATDARLAKQMRVAMTIDSV